MMIIDMRKEGGEKKKARRDRKERKGKVYQMASASLFFIAAKVAGTFLQTAESVFENQLDV